MFELSFNELTLEQFLAEYWQKKPLLIRAGFKNFQDPIEPDELAGLAVEECIESRIITNHGAKWQAYHGPFESFEKLTETNSTLLVQAVDHWHPDCAALLEPFRFIPNWRIDDLMISYSTPGGGVGPHLDQYDVFIIQGAGKRHWRVGDKNQRYNEVIPCKDLLQIDAFEACIDTHLLPGDILYIPPGSPHEGYAIDNSLNYSVGFRAPNQIDMLSSFSDYLIDNELGKLRYGDSNINLRNNPGEVKSSEINAIKALLKQAIDEPGVIEKWFGQSLSEAKHELDLCTLDEPYSEDELTDIINTESTLFSRLGGARFFYQHIENKILFSINGTNYTLNESCLPWVELLSANTSLTSDQLKSSTTCSHFVHLFTKLINDGYWYLD